MNELTISEAKLEKEKEKEREKKNEKEKEKEKKNEKEKETEKQKATEKKKDNKDQRDSTRPYQLDISVENSRNTNYTNAPPRLVEALTVISLCLRK